MEQLMAPNLSKKWSVIVRLQSAALNLGYVFLVLAGVAIFTLQSGSASGTSEPAKDKDLSSFRIKIRRLQEGISEKRTEMAESEKEAKNILSELEELDSKLSHQREKLRNLEEKKDQQQKLIDREERALKRLYREKDIVQDHLRNRIIAYYTMGDIGLLNVTFSTKTLPELLTFHDAFDSLIKYDQDVIKVYGETIEELEKTKDALDLEQTVLQSFIDETMKEKLALEEIMAEKRDLLERVRTQAQLHKQAIAEMQEATEDLAKSIVAIKTKSQTDDNSFTANKGNLPPPVDGVLLTLFQQEKENKLGVLRKCQGIELQARDGVNIIAVSSGEVIYAGYLRGYGNTVIIHHGFQYYTITSRIEKITVSKGQMLQAENVIGIMGTTATLFDEGLYFEIRHSRQSLDPLLWLNPNRLSVPHELISGSGNRE